MNPMCDDIELDPELCELAAELSRQLDAVGSVIDVRTPSLATIGSDRSARPHRLRPVAVAAAAMILTVLGAGVVLTRGVGTSSVQVAADSGATPVTTSAGPSGWQVGLDPASGFQPTYAKDTCCETPPDTSAPPGYRGGALYTQHWVGVYADPTDPLAGPLLSIETDFSPKPGSPGAPATHPTFDLPTAHGPAPAWDTPAPDGMTIIGYQVNDDHVVTVGAYGMSRDAVIAAVHDLTIGPKGRAEMPNPPGLVPHRVNEPLNEASLTIYADHQPQPRQPLGRELLMNVVHGSDGPDLLEASQSLFTRGPLPATTGPAVERVTVNGRTALLRRLGGGAAVLITYDPVRQRTVTLTGQGGIDGDELIRLAGQLHDIDDATWQALLARCSSETDPKFC